MLHPFNTFSSFLTHSTGPKPSQLVPKFIVTPSGPIISINTTDFEDGGSGEVIQIFFKIPQIHQVLFRYLPEVTAPKNSFPRAPTRDKPGEPIKSAPTFEEVL